MKGKRSRSREGEHTDPNAGLTPVKDGGKQGGTREEEPQSKSWQG